MITFSVDEESRFNSDSVQILKACPSKSQTSETPSENEVADNLIYELLNALIAKPVEVPKEGNVFLFSINVLVEPTKSQI